MARLIDADKIMDELRDYADRKCANGYMDTANGILSAVNYIRNNVTRVDAVEVVRCEKCKNAVWDEENEMWKCVESAEYDEELGEWFGFYEYHNGDFFCSYGERKDDD